MATKATLNYLYVKITFVSIIWKKIVDTHICDCDELLLCGEEVWNFYHKSCVLVFFFYFFPPKGLLEADN